ncbi:HpcH/HpaI aldolase/citrate lyase family protein [Streptomyces himalayensis]|uniref:CoA ester lyase n=1 Tax=Streptomyces himalayensis subsp. himalayensis TaxID=2756131 RepID=A0A7W0DP46_9ACTN|nr:CoA ester lyase [Streptomyces himalayensis]MBA2948689.1 CoA ester lyase [Streptomyces himalayensis subsp. himalayensis]
MRGTAAWPPAPPPLTWLYAPGDRPDVAAKALASGADVVVIDLEDAVALHRKEYARAATAELLSVRPPVPVHVRINTLDSPFAEADIRAVAALPGLSALRLPKITSPDDVVRIAELAAPAEGGALPLYALLESALGVERAFAVASAHPALRGIALGEADLRADLGVLDDAGLDWARGRIVLAARAAGLAPPAQSVYPDVRDIDGLAASCAHGRALGFLGRMAIHPRQLAVIKRSYLPSPAEIASAEEILKSATSDSGALALPDGRFVDPAIVACAHRTLALAQHAD